MPPSPRPPTTNEFQQAYRQVLYEASFPRSLHDFNYRITENLRLYYPIYCFFPVVVFLLTLLITRPGAFLLFTSITLAWVYVLFVRDVPWIPFDLDGKIMVGFLWFVSLISPILSKVLWQMVYALGVGVLCMLTHAIIYPPEVNAIRNDHDSEEEDADSLAIHFSEEEDEGCNV